MVCIFLHSMVLILWSKEVSDPQTLAPHGAKETAKVYHLKLGKSPQDSAFSELVKMIARLEIEQGIKINPLNYPEIAINFDTRTAPGLYIQSELINGLIKFLEIRGYGKEEVRLVTYYLDRQTRQSLEKELPGYRIITSQSDSYFHPDWFHDSPIPPAMGDRAELLIKYPNNSDIRSDLERKSALPASLFFGKTYWINLATAMDDYYLGINGACSNASVNASSNTQRFRKDFTMGPAAVTEILAIPEFWEKQLFSLIDLRAFQIAGGPQFNAEFIRKEPILLMSKNPVFLDFHTMELIRQKRALAGLDDRKTQDFKLFKFARELGLGDSLTSELIELSSR